MQKAVSSSFSSLSRHHPFERAKRQLYWEGTGAHQLKYEELMESLGNTAFPSEEGCDPLMRLFNGMAGCYYGFYNDGDNAFGAIDNNRVHGFRTVDAFAEFCKEHGAWRAECYVRHTEHHATLLESAMDEVIKLVYSKKKKE